MNKVYTYNELKESKLIYDRKPPAFGVIITWLTLIFLTAIIIWAVLSPKSYVVKAAGIVSDGQKVNVMNTVTGKIKNIAVKEGQAVSKGDLLIEIDTYQLDLQIAQIEDMTELYNERVKADKTLIDYVNGYRLDDESTQANPFDQNDENTVKLYSDAETFKSYVKSSIEQASEESPYTQESLDSMKSQILTQLQAYANLEQYISERTKQESQLKMYKDSLTEYKITAKIDGVIHLSAGLTVGTMLSQSVVLGTISSGDTENLYFDAGINAIDRSKIDVDSNVEIAVSGIAQTEYGTLKGNIVEIDKDSTQTEDGQIYYRIKVIPTETFLTDKNGNVIHITNGMPVECRIKYDETTWFNWLIEQIVGKTK